MLIDVIDNQHRGVELPCNRDFWLAVQEELLPLVQAVAPFSDRADRTVVAGQSFGGLAAMYAALHWPQRFGCVLSQSGSYWWPQRGSSQPGVILEQLQRGELRPQGLRIWLEAGVREPIIFRANRAFRATTAEHAVRFLAPLTAVMTRMLARRADVRAYPAVAAFAPRATTRA